MTNQGSTMQKQRYTATIQPEAWVDDHAIPSGPVVSADVTALVEAMPAEKRTAFDQMVAEESTDFDDLYFAAAALGLVPSGFGPFTCTVAVEDAQGAEVETQPEDGDDGPTRRVLVTITRVQQTFMRLPVSQPLTEEALDDADWEHLWDHQDYDTSTASVTVEEAPATGTRGN